MVMPKIVNLLLNGLYTDILETQEYSEIINFYVYAGFLNVILTYGMETAFFRFYNKSNKKKEVYTTALISLLVSLVFFSTIVYLFSDVFISLLGVSKSVLFMMLGLVAFDILVVIPFAYYRLMGQALKYFWIRVFTLVVMNACLNYFFLILVPKHQISLPTVFSFENKEDYVFLANFLANVTMLLLVFPNYFRYKWKFDIVIFNKMRRYGAPILIAGFAFLMVENLDKILLRDLLGKEIMGAYGACYKLGVFLMLFIQAFRMGIEPFFFSQASKSDAKQSYAIVLKFFVIFASLGVLTVLTFLDVFVSIIIKDKSYLKAIGIVPVILLGNWCLGVYQSLSVWYKVTDKTKFGMYFTIIGAVITIAVNYILIPSIGFMASAYATLIAYGGMMLLSYFYGRKYYKVPYQIESMLLYFIIALGLSFFTWYLYPNNYIIKGLAIMLYLGVVILKEKETVKEIIKQA